MAGIEWGVLAGTALGGGIVIATDTVRAVVGRIFDRQDRRRSARREKADRMLEAAERLCNIAEELQELAPRSAADADFDRLIGEARACYRTLRVLSWSEVVRTQAAELLERLGALQRLRWGAGDRHLTDDGEEILIGWDWNVVNNPELSRAISTAAGQLLGGMSAIMESVE